MNTADRPPENLRAKPKYEIKTIQGRQHAVIRFLAMGRLSQVDIAKICGYTKEEVSYIANSEIAKRQINLMRGNMDEKAMDITRHIEQVIAPKATKLLESIIDNVDKDGYILDAPLRLRADVAKTMLSRGGHGEQSKQQITGAIAIVDGSAIEDIKRRSMERKAKEINYEEVSNESESS